MTTSGSADFNQTRDQIITDALQLIGRIGEGETPTTNAINLCSNLLNKLVKHWETMGIHLWTSSFGTLFLNKGQNKYKLSSSRGDFACDDSTLVETTLTSTGSGSTLTVGTTTGMTVGDNIGVQLDAGTRFWSTISSIGSSTSVTLTSPLTSNASSGNTVFSFTALLDRPLHIIDANLTTSSGYSRPLNIRYGQAKFNQIPNKSTQAPPTVAYYLPQDGIGYLYTWPTCDSDISNRIKFAYVRSIQDFNSGTDNPDLPYEWLHALTYNLARIVAPSYGIDLTKKDPNDILMIAKESLAELMMWDSEQSTIQIIPDERHDY